MAQPRDHGAVVAETHQLISLFGAIVDRVTALRTGAEPADPSRRAMLAAEFLAGAPFESDLAQLIHNGNEGDAAGGAA